MATKFEDERSSLVGEMTMRDGTETPDAGRKTGDEAAKRPYQKPAIVEEVQYETSALLACGKAWPSCGPVARSD